MTIELTLRCTSVVHDFVSEEDGAVKRKSSETATFADAECPIDVLMDRKSGMHLHATAAERFGGFKRDRVYRVTVEEVADPLKVAERPAAPRYAMVT